MKEAMKEMYQLLLTEPHAPTVCAKLERIAREALAQQELIKRAEEAFEASEHEPVNGCVCRWNSEGDRVVTCERHQGWLEVIAEWADRARDAEKKLKALNTSPPAQRKPLTDEQIESLLMNWPEDGIAFFEFARAIEAAHGIKE